MKKQTRLAVVTTAAALLAIGASFTSMAAQKGTWNLEDGEWYCYDSDGDVIEDAFCLSNGKEFYVGDDGRLVRNSWVEVDGSWYYVNSAGEKVVNDWRYTVPAEDDEEGEKWFYLQSNGKRTEGKKMVINGKTYYFNDDGEMLTGWVQEAGDSWAAADSNDVSATATFYCDENGVRLSNQWIKTYAPGVEADDADEDDRNWYYIRSTGKPAVGKQSSINGQTYFFNVYGEMLSGWVTGTSSNYEEIWSEEGNSMTLSAAAAEGRDIYFCGGEDDGHAKKDRWVKEYNSVDFGADDSDNSKFWFYFDKNGKAFVPTADEIVSAQTWTLEDAYAEDGKRFESGETCMAATKKIDSKTYAFNQDGEMLHGFVEMDEKMYYFGGEEDGTRKTGSVTVKDENGQSVKAYFSTETNETEGYYLGAGVNGAKSGKLYEDGILVNALEDKYELKEVAGMKFVVNKSGAIQSDDGPYKDNGDELFGGAKFTYNTDTKGVSYKSVASMTE